MVSIIKYLIGGLVGVVVMSTLSSAQTINGWKIEPIQNGKIVAMSYSNPHTQLDIEQRILVNLGPDEVVLGGTVRFRNGFDRVMDQTEANNYFEVLNGPKALWDYLESRGQLISVSKGQNIPPDWNGKIVRIVESSGTQVIGTLILAKNTEDSAVKVKGAADGPVSFSMKEIKSLQRIR